MKIVILDLDNLKNPLLAAGQAHATREVGKLLALRHEVVVYCSKYPGWRDYQEDGIQYRHIGWATGNMPLNNLIYLLSLPFTVMRLRADVILESFVPPWSVSFAPLFTRIPVVGLPSMFNAKAFSQKYHLPFQFIERFGCKFYRYFAPYSKTDLRKMRRYNPDITYRSIPQGVGQEYFRIKRQRPEHILFLGRFDMAQKGIDLLLHAYAKVADRIGLPLVLAGHGPDEPKIRTLIQRLDLDHKVQVAGSAYGQKKFDLMAKALFVAFPSRHDEQCLWTLEALAAGLPLAAFTLPESAWLPRTVCLKAPRFDLSRYANVLLKMASDPALVQAMSAEAQGFSGQFKWEEVADGFESFFEEVLALEAAKATEARELAQN